MCADRLQAWRGEWIATCRLWPVSRCAVLHCAQVAPLADDAFAMAATDGIVYPQLATVLIGYLGLLAVEYLRGMKYPTVRQCR